MENNFFKDKHIAFLFVNVISVIISYLLAGLLGLGIVVLVTPIRTLILLYSILLLIKELNKTDFSLQAYRLNEFYIFASSVLITCLLSVDFFYTFSKVFQFLIPLYYIVLVCSYLKTNYSSDEIWRTILIIFNISFIIPIVNFFVFGNGFSATNIYGESSGFISNQYGWASTFFILTTIDLLSNNWIKKVWYKRVILIMIIPAAYLLMISGNRSSYISIALTFCIYIGLRKNLHIILRGVIILAIVFFISDQLNNQKSILNIRIAKTVNQLNDAEKFTDNRATAREIGFRLMDENPTTYIHGFGLFAFRQAVRKLDPTVRKKLIKSGVHNSYFELLFGCGFIVFAIFLIIYILKPIHSYFILYFHKLLYILPVFIIPFFESNLTGGQFLFYPWLLTASMLKK